MNSSFKGEEKRGLRSFIYIKFKGRGSGKESGGYIREFVLIFIVCIN
jgi:hypothetical protein